MPSIFEEVKAVRPRRNAFNLSHSKQFSCDLGQLIPVLIEPMVPGDTFILGCELVARVMPMMTPILHEINCFFHVFFVPLRLMDTGWEDFITGGELGTDASTMDRWTPTGGNVTNDSGAVVADNGVGSLWDYCGFPTGVVPTGVLPYAFVNRAYNKVWNDHYRDQNTQVEIAEDSMVVKNRAWEKDYFTSALPNQQKGTAPGFPLSGLLNVEGTGVAFQLHNATDATARDAVLTNAGLVGTTTSPSGTDNLHFGATTGLAADATDAVTFDIADVRLANQIQVWMERNARGGARYVEWLKMHHGVSPKDSRLQRAEYVGGVRMPLMVSEVLQTSESDTTPQGTMAGHGMSAGGDMVGSYYAEEFGILIGLFSAMPRPAYFQGVPRQFLYESRYDWYDPAWANLSEQPIVRGELYATAVENENETVFGYQGRFNELRTRQNQVCGLMRPGVAGTLGDYWNIVREFAAAPELNETFLRCVPRKEWLAASSQPALLVHFANKVKAIRPIPVEAEPSQGR